MDTKKSTYKWIIECGECGSEWYSDEIEVVCLGCGGSDAIILDVENEYYGHKEK